MSYKNIFIVGGHSDTDPGAIAKDGTTERSVIVPIAQRVADILRNSNNANVMTIGVFEGKKDLQEKINYEVDYCTKTGLNFSNSLLVSLHCDWKEAKEGYGGFYYSGSALSESFLGSILDALCETDSGKRQCLYTKGDREHQKKQLGIIRNTESLACLVEMGSLRADTNEFDGLEYLKSEKGQEEIARAIVKGICKFAEWKIPEYEEEKIIRGGAYQLENIFVPTISAQWEFIEEFFRGEDWAEEVKKKLHEANTIVRNSISQKLL